MRFRSSLASCLLTLLALGLAGCQDDAADPAGLVALEGHTVPSAPAAEVVAAEGLAPHPESAVHDPAADVYLVSNLGENTGGEAFSHLFDADDNGFISRVELNPNGTVANVVTHWIGHASTTPMFEADVDGITGITIQGGSLYAVDRDEILVFDLDDPSSSSSIPLPASGMAASSDLSLPNDIVVASDGTVWLTDTGLAADAGRTMTDAVWSWDGSSWTKMAGGDPGSSDLGCPNGIDLDKAGRPLFLTFCSNEVKRIGMGGVETVVTVEGPAEGVGRLDGLVHQKSGKLIYSDWRVPQAGLDPGGGVLRWTSPGARTVNRVILEGLTFPADIGFDAKRQRVLIPSDGDQALKIVRGGG